MKLLPTTKLGKWSAGLIMVSILLFFIVTVVVVGIFKQEGGENFADNLYISVPMLVAFVSALSALVTGVICVVKDKERSLAVFAIISLGLIMAIFVVGELVVPH